MKLKPCRKPEPERCPNCPFKSRTVGSRGREDAPVVVVGESPGSTEVRQGAPFVGPSGKLLDMMLKEAGIKPRDVYITNAFRCLPPRSRDTDGVKKKDLLINDACRSCRDRLVEEVSAHPRKLVLAMGNAATRSLANQWNLSITRVRGQLIPSPLAELGILPMFHPAHVLRNATLMPQLRIDFGRAARMLAGEAFPKPIVTYEVLDTPQKVDAFIKLAWKKVYESDRETPQAIANGKFSWGRYLVGDIETTGLDRYKDKFRCIGLMFADEARENGRNVVRVISGKNGGELLKRFFNGINRDTQWVWHNGKFDTSFLRAKGMPRQTARVDHDTMLLSYSLDEIGGRHGLEQCIVDHLGLPAYKNQLDEYVGKGKKKKAFADVPKDVLYKYMADDVVFTALLFRKLAPRVAKRPHLWRAYTELLVPASNTLATIELNGMPIDQHVLKQSETELYAEMEPIVAEMQRMVRDEDFNPNSTKKLLDVLRLKYKLKVRSTDKDTLKEHEKHPFVAVLMKYRAKQKLLSTYIRPFMKYGARVHTSYLIHGTVTGRLSSSGPNMQNIPKERIVRRHFRAPKGRCFIAIDYSQAELRSLAVLSGDQALMDIFRSGQDLHTAVAALVFGKEFTSLPEKIPDPAIPERMIKNPPWDAIRRKAKTINFGVVYGVTPPTLAERLAIPIEEAEELVDGWFKRFPKAKEFMDKCRRAPLEGRPLTTVFGRQRRFYLITNANMHGIQNEAGNFPHQSMCSDFTLRAAIELDPMLSSLPGNVRHINIVHDDNVFEIDDNPDAIRKLVHVAKGVMEQVPRNYGIDEITFEAEASKGYDWAAMEGLKDEGESEAKAAKATQSQSGEAKTNGRKLSRQPVDTVPASNSVRDTSRRNGAGEPRPRRAA